MEIKSGRRTCQKWQNYRYVRIEIDQALPIVYSRLLRMWELQSQLELTWCLKNENVSSFITGSSRPEQIVVNTKCLGLLKSVASVIMDDIDQVMGNTLARDPARQG